MYEELTVDAVRSFVAEESEGDQSLTLPGNKLINQSVFLSHSVPPSNAFSITCIQVHLSLSLRHLWYAVPSVGLLLYYLRVKCMCIPLLLTHYAATFRL
jgi:hypothetical protein